MKIAKMRFTKMHGIGNDYVYINGFKEILPVSPEELAVKVSDRHFGIGGDGLVLILPPNSEQADAQMRMFNADGSEGKMCGNAIRCVAKFLYDHGICTCETLKIETASGLKTLELSAENGKVAQVRVDMGKPILNPTEIPTLLLNKGESIIDFPLDVAGREFRITTVSMGNPHCVIFCDELADELVFGIGPKIEKLTTFPDRINVEFVKVQSPTELHMRVWERGSGETLACGTGACAAAVAAVLTNRANRELIVHLLGGDLRIEWSQIDNHVYKTGPATEIFSGEYVCTTHE